MKEKRVYWSLCEVESLRNSTLEGCSQGQRYLTKKNKRRKNIVISLLPASHMPVPLILKSNQTAAGQQGWLVASTGVGLSEQRTEKYGVCRGQ